jgi:hypothetical protein
MTELSLSAKNIIWIKEINSQFHDDETDVEYKKGGKKIIEVMKTKQNV